MPCRRCGSLGVEPHPEDSDVMLACRRCGDEERWRRLPFFSLTGASGSGKSTLVRNLWRALPECIALDGDVLWDPKFWTQRAEFYLRWLGLAAQLSQTGRPVVLCTAAMPTDWESSPLRVLVADVHMYALVCAEPVLVERLGRRERPRDVEAPGDFLKQTLAFNAWLRDNVPHVDTSVLDTSATARCVTDWIRQRL